MQPEGDEPHRTAVDGPANALAAIMTGMEADRTSPTPLADSPWFWLYAFATCALVLLVLFGDKFTALRTQDERAFQGRVRALQQKQGQDPSVAMSREGENLLTLRPIYILLAAMIAVGWGTLWWQRWRQRRPRQVSAVPSARDPSPNDTA